MQDPDSQYFAALKKEVVKTLKRSYPAISDDIQEWKGQTILFLQDDLLEKVNDQVSEKWFYNHMKATAPKLPRVDMLNLLSRYTGFADWQDFMFNHQEITTPFEKNDRANRIFITIPLIVTSILAVLFLLFKLTALREYQFCFVSFDDPSLVPSKVQVDILNEEESPRSLYGDSTGCIQLKLEKTKLRFIVKAPYYKTDTVERVLRKFDRNETIRLKTDDYALMLHYFSTSNTEDWKKRRQQLDMMLTDSVRIFEVYNEGTIGLELYDKWEFINKLSVPTKSLQQIYILDTEYFQDQIITLRFTQKRIANED